MREFDQFQVGMRAEESTRVTDQIVYDLADVSGNYNPINVSEEFARKTRFGRRIAPALFCESLISKLVGMRLPGSGAVFVNLDIDFIKPVYIGETITTVGTITGLEPEKNLIKMEILCHNESGDLIVKCATKVLYPDVE